MTGRFGGIVLAGGRSSRFGRDKLDENVDGRRLLDRAVSAVLSIDPAIDVVVVGAPGAQRIVPTGVRLVHDATGFEGPLAGVATGLRALAPEVDRVIVVGGDMPRLAVPVMTALLDALEPPFEAALLEQDDDGRPLPSAYRRVPAGGAVEILRTAGERRLRALPMALTTRLVPASVWRVLDPDGASLLDIDAPDDLKVSRPPG
jgi:molybdopterin-guanine dinucleotide biosynthesis protein A